jgi:hypothetical protein
VSTSSDIPVIASRAVQIGDCCEVVYHVKRQSALKLVAHPRIRRLRSQEHVLCR